MASCSLNMPEDFLLKLATLGAKTDEIVPRVLEAGGEIVLEKVRSNLRSVIGNGTKYDSRSTGQLVSALGMSAARQDRDGNWNIKVGFAENRSDGVSNALIANVLEYGKSGQPPRPFLKLAKTQSRAAALSAMTEKLNEELSVL
ncbi:hypothetical protein FACS1894217_03740 [Clostridia bacterium]|nr:hypothetical protein FACS1894217_03740 [Clostridia bacterium]GHV20376.1 hypothetical protein FACS189425_11030 [Clostridia bacterium]GHV38082.1 hypothetical protein FACS18949_18340 [Clostridia bacterium]